MDVSFRPRSLAAAGTLCLMNIGAYAAGDQESSDQSPKKWNRADAPPDFLIVIVIVLDYLSTIGSGLRLG
jgi:hypothetical protein